jgi:hypothetical protein
VISPFHPRETPRVLNFCEPQIHPEVLEEVVRGYGSAEHRMYQSTSAPDHVPIRWLRFAEPLPIAGACVTLGGPLAASALGS